MSNQLLFVYGTLLDDATREQVIGRKITGMPDVLPDYSEQTIEVGNQPYPCAEAAEGSTIQGLRFELSGEELEKVDAYETGSYERKQAVLASGDMAWVYTLS
jgi:gamma-glutamylcyclotransferase (GGCT)/AIG2-like uncharacterized protein YtfP